MGRRKARKKKYPKSDLQMGSVPSLIEGVK
jgi:hypothetical protein